MKLTKARIFKLLIIIPLTLIVISAAVITALYHYFPEEKIIAYLSAEGKKATGKNFEIEGLSYGLGSIHLKNVSVTEPESGQEILGLEELTIDFSLMPLLRRELEVSGISLISPRVRLSFDSEGRTNLHDMFKPRDEELEKPREFKASISRINLRDARIDLESPPPYVGLPTGVYIVSADIFPDDEGVIGISACTLEGPGGIGRLLPELTIYHSEGFRMEGRVKIENSSLAWIYQWKKTKEVPFLVINGNVEDLVITTESVSGRAVATSTLRGTDLILHANGRCVVDITNRVINVINARGRINSSNFLLNLLTLDFSANLLEFGASEIDADVVDISYILPMLPDELFGRFSGNLSYKKFYNGNLTLRGLGYGRKSRLISDVNTSVVIKDNEVKRENITLKINNYPAVVSLATRDNSFKNFFLKVEADNLKIDLPGGEEGGSGGGGINPPIDINGSVHVKNFIHDDYRFRNLNALFSFRNGRVNVNRLTTEFSGGKLIIQSNINTAASKMPGEALINFQGIRVHELFGQWDKLDKRIFGSLAGRSKIDFELSERFYRSLNGTVEFSVDRGKIVDTGIQHGLGIWLSELKYKLRDLEFNKIYGNLNIQGEKISVNSFIFNSPNIRLNIKGAIDKRLVADYVTIELEFTSQFISDLTPAVIFGLSNYREGMWYTIPFSATGDLTDGRNIKRIK